MTALTYRLTLEQPALLAAPGGDPNSATSLPYVPGSALRGAVASRYARTAGGFDAAAPEAHRFFFSGATRFLHAYPVVKASARDRGTRGLPAPRSLRRRKGEEGAWYDFSSYAPPPDDADPYPAVGVPFVRLDPGEMLAYGVRPERRIAIHTARDRRFGRAREGSGAVFRYDALAPGQTLEGAILCDRPADADRLADLLGHTVYVGAARSAGYGRAALHDVEVLRDWHESGSTGGEDALVITLLSETLLRDPASGQPAPSAAALTAALATALGASLDSPRTAFVDSAVVGGFNRAWNLPLPQTPALAAGSVVVFDRPSDLSAERLRALEEDGIGERRAEGYGRLAVNSHGGVETFAYEPTRALSADALARQRVAVPEGAEAYALAERMAHRMYEAEIARRVVSRAAELAEQRALRKPTNSQIGRLRATLLRALYLSPGEGRALIARYLDSLAERAITREQFEGDRFDGEASLLAWLRTASQAETLRPELVPDAPPQVGLNVEATDTPELAYRIHVRFAHEILLRAAKARPADAA